MKVKHIILPIFLLLAAQMAIAQTEVATESVAAENVDCDAEFEKLRKLYSDMFNSPSVINYRKIKKDFFDKLPSHGIRFTNSEATSCSDQILSWIEVNIEKTTFKDFEEAKLHWQRKNEARVIGRDENPELYKYVEEFKKNCGNKDRNFFLELIQEYGTEFYL